MSVAMDVFRAECVNGTTTAFSSDYSIEKTGVRYMGMTMARLNNDVLYVSFTRGRGDYGSLTLKPGQKSGILFKRAAVEIDHNGDHVVVRVPRNTSKEFRKMMVKSH